MIPLDLATPLVGMAGMSPGAAPRAADPAAGFARSGRTGRRRVRDQTARQCGLVHQLTRDRRDREELGVQASASHAVEPARAAGHPAGRLADQGVATVFVTYSQRDDRDDSNHDPAEEQSDGHCDDTGHDKLPHFRPAESVPRGLLPATPAWLGVLAGLVFVGDGIAVCPQCVPAVRYVPLSLVILLSGAIWQVLVHPSRPTARIDQLHPAIQAIPTFGTCGSVLPRPDRV